MPINHSFILKKFKKFIKVTIAICAILLIALLIAAHVFLQPASDDKVRKELSEGISKPYILNKEYKGFKYRAIAMQKELDSTKPVLIFVHGSPGSSLDYKRYLNDTLLNEKFNLITYDRVGYGNDNLGKIQGSLVFELEILHHLIKDIPEEEIVLAGYSYGGPVVLASEKNYKYKVSMASAVVGEYEPMFGVLNFYKWKLTRPLVPAMFRAAAKEKFSHLEELPNYKDKWNVSPSKIINIHGNKDFIVPYANSEFLQDVIDKEKFKMVTIKGGGHDLIWSDFNLIKSEILKTIP